MNFFSRIAAFFVNFITSRLPTRELPIITRQLPVVSIAPIVEEIAQQFPVITEGTSIIDLPKEEIKQEVKPINNFTEELKNYYLHSIEVFDVALTHLRAMFTNKATKNLKNYIPNLEQGKQLLVNAISLKDATLIDPYLLDFNLRYCATILTLCQKDSTARISFNPADLPN